MKVLFLAPYPHDSAPSQRFRFEQYLDHLTREGNNCEFVSFWNERGWDLLYTPNKAVEKASNLIHGYWRRIMLLRKLSGFDFVFIHREATPLGPPWMEWIIRYILKIPFIYDFDDAIWMPDTLSHSTLLKFTRYPEKVGSICRWSYKISCGNSFLADFAKRHNPSVSIIPTTIDTQNYHIPAHGDHNPLIIGWTGSHSTLPYLEEVIPILRNLRNRFDFVLKVICNKQPGFEFPDLHYVKWSKQDEIAELNGIDIGIMPLPDTDWSKGKCGFKILQYMALEKPAVASAVGVNTEIIQNGQNGLLCHRQSDWSHNLKLLLTNRDLRNKLGKNGRATVERHYSKSAIAASFLSLFE